MLQSLTSTLSCAEHFYGAECAVRLKCSIEWKNPTLYFLRIRTVVSRLFLFFFCHLLLDISLKDAAT